MKKVPLSDGARSLSIVNFVEYPPHPWLTLVVEPIPVPPIGKRLSLIYVLRAAGRTQHWRRGQVIHEMFSSNENGANAIPKFNSYLGLRWTRWLTSFELFADGKSSIINDNTNANTKTKTTSIPASFSGIRCSGDLLNARGHRSSDRLDSPERIFRTES